MPAADKHAHDFIGVQPFPGADGQFIKRRADDAISDIERGRAVFAGNTSAVLRIQLIVALVADSAGIVQGFGPCVGGYYVETVAKAT